MVKRPSNKRKCLDSKLEDTFEALVADQAWSKE